MWSGRFSSEMGRESGSRIGRVAAHVGKPHQEVRTDGKRPPPYPRASSRKAASSPAAARAEPEADVAEAGRHEDEDSRPASPRVREREAGAAVDRPAAIRACGWRARGGSNRRRAGFTEALTGKLDMDDEARKGMAATSVGLIKGR